MINLYHQTNSGFKGEDVGSKIKAVVLLLFIHCLLFLSLFVFFLALVLLRSTLYPF